MSQSPLLLPVLEVLIKQAGGFVSVSDAELQAVRLESKIEQEYDPATKSWVFTLSTPDGY